MALGALAVLIAAAGAVAVVHSILPDHWVPLAVVARAQRWSLIRVTGFSSMAAGGHVLASLLLAGVVALVGLRFQTAIQSQQGHIVGGVLVVTGLAIFAWSRTGRGRVHGSDDGHSHGDNDAGDQHHDHAYEHDSHGDSGHDGEPHRHQHDQPGCQNQDGASHAHEHSHAQVVHSHPHSHEEFIESRRQMLIERSQASSWGGRLAAITVPFGVAASPDLSLLPVALAASAFGVWAVATVLVVFAVLTIATFVGLTLAGTIAGYQIRGRWLEDNANSITGAVLVAIGVVAYFGI